MSLVSGNFWIASAGRTLKLIFPGSCGDYREKETQAQRVFAGPRTFSVAS